ncbi:hypothetical protein J5N97_026242 [Dioscorea zingiberensis]|uniref:Uncharacterized protein n=1 Tax=Dioscorea zingiberensis TaxID=325984 RepID=A0A9D5H6B5_9LILI|nr:hypothetical protein J5N97_026242 [Dioscorea zingiberensis]
MLPFRVSPQFSSFILPIEAIFHLEAHKRKKEVVDANTRWKKKLSASRFARRRSKMFGAAGNQSSAVQRAVDLSLASDSGSPVGCRWQRGTGAWLRSWDRCELAMAGCRWRGAGLRRCRTEWRRSCTAGRRLPEEKTSGGGGTSAHLRTAAGRVWPQRRG